MDVLAPTTMKNAAKCDTSCDTQIPVSHQNFERNLRFPGSMSVGVSVHTHHKTMCVCGVSVLYMLPNNVNCPCVCSRKSAQMDTTGDWRYMLTHIPPLIPELNIFVTELRLKKGTNPFSYHFKWGTMRRKI